MTTATSTSVPGDSTLGTAVMPLARDQRGTVLAQLRQVCIEGRIAPGPRRAGLATGFPSLDAVLPGGGWPLGSVIELLGNVGGSGELSLLLPALRGLALSGRFLVFIAPPHCPYEPALSQAGIPLANLLLVDAAESGQALWAAEQLLRCPAVGAVLMWPAHIDERRVRRLQLAAETGGGCGLLYRPAPAVHSASPAALRLQLQAMPEGLRIEIRKSRGGHAHALVVHPAIVA